MGQSPSFFQPHFQPEINQRSHLLTDSQTKYAVAGRQENVTNLRVLNQSNGPLYLSSSPAGLGTLIQPSSVQQTYTIPSYVQYYILAYDSLNALRIVSEVPMSGDPDLCLTVSKPNTWGDFSFYSC